MVAKNEGFFNILDSVHFVERLKGPLRSIGEDLLHPAPAWVIFEDWFEHLDGLEFRSVA